MKTYIQSCYQIIFENEHGETFEYLVDDMYNHNRIEMMHEMMVLYYLQNQSNVNKVNMIKVIRAAFGMPLKAAKFMVEDAQWEAFKVLAANHN